MYHALVYTQLGASDSIRTRDYSTENGLRTFGIAPAIRQLNDGAGARLSGPYIVAIWKDGKKIAAFQVADV